MTEEPLETPDNFGRLPPRNARDWRREDRERFRSSGVIARLSAVLVIPVTFVAAVLATTGHIAYTAALAVVIAAWLVGLAALWFGARQSRARR